MFSPFSSLHTTSFLYTFVAIPISLFIATNLESATKLLVFSSFIPSSETSLYARLSPNTFVNSATFLNSFSFFSSVVMFNALCLSM